MIGKNIKRIRKEKGMSQEELAAAIHVVRQTVSKWENGCSLPDAEALIHMSALFGVPVDEILGIGKEEPAPGVTEELEKANEWIERKKCEEHNRLLAGRKRGLILMFSILAMTAALIFKNQFVSLIVVAGFTLSAVIVLFRNLSLLTMLTTNDMKSGVLKAVTVFDFIVFSVCVAGVFLIGCDVIPIEDDGRIFAMMLVAGAMVFSGMISPKLPFNRHTGLRLPWTVTDRDTWNIAHRTLGFTAMPTAILYIAATLTIDHFKAVSLGAVVLWVGVPMLISYVYHYRKTYAA